MVPMGLVRHRHMSRLNSGGFVRQAGVSGQSNSAMEWPPRANSYSRVRWTLDKSRQEGRQCGLGWVSDCMDMSGSRRMRQKENPNFDAISVTSPRQPIPSPPVKSPVTSVATGHTLHESILEKLPTLLTPLKGES
jgi:hypothetical protein